MEASQGATFEEDTRRRWGIIDRSLYDFGHYVVGRWWLRFTPGMMEESEFRVTLYPHDITLK